MKLLFDSHAIFWAMLDAPNLSATAISLIDDPDNECLISPVNHWEMAIKISVGKYRVNNDFQTLWMEAIARFGVLRIEPRHTARLIALPFHHKDPFDRLLVAQALSEGIPLLSSDATLDLYGIQRIW